MSMSVRLQNQLNAGGKSFAMQRTISCDGLAMKEVSVPAAKNGTLTTRTDANTGTLTMAASHGITTGARLDVYWTEGGVLGSRRGMTVGTVATNSVPIDGGSGNDLPTNNTVITAMVPVLENISVVDGDDVVVIAAFSSLGPAHFVIAEADGTEAEDLSLPEDAQSYVWYATSGITNPLANTLPTKMWVSHGDSTAAATMRLAMGYN